MRKIAIIGGGAAGMMVAGMLSTQESNDDIVLFEKNSSLGTKVIISGGGRCNLTTGISTRRELKHAYTRGRTFFEPSLKKFTPRMVRKWFEQHGVQCKEEEDHRVFPVSNDGKEVVRMFEKIISQKIAIHYKEPLITIEKGKISGYTITTTKKDYEFDFVVFTTGGNAYSHTGSSGDGYALARSLGHSISQLGPSLNSFATKEKWIHPLSGLSFQNASIKCSQQGIKGTANGPVLITHFGISGPGTFILASQTAFSEVSGEKSLTIRLQADANYSQDWLDSHLLDQMKIHGKKELGTTLSQLYPKRFVHTVLGELDILIHKKTASLTKNERQSLTDRLGNGIPLTLIKRRPGDEFVTAGGITRTEIDPHRLESLICPGIYFAGEILNIDGVTGGYNLQMCWSTGKAVADAIHHNTHPKSR